MLDVFAKVIVLDRRMQMGAMAPELDKQQHWDPHGEHADGDHGDVEMLLVLGRLVAINAEIVHEYSRLGPGNIKAPKHLENTRGNARVEQKHDCKKRVVGKPALMLGNVLARRASGQSPLSLADQNGRHVRAFDGQNDDKRRAQMQQEFHTERHRERAHLEHSARR